MDLGPVQQDPQRIWTIAVYMGADNDLDRFALKDLRKWNEVSRKKGSNALCW